MTRLLGLFVAVWFFFEALPHDAAGQVRFDAVDLIIIPIIAIAVGLIVTVLANLLLFLIKLAWVD